MSLLVLAFTAASLGFLHTLLGPDHYLPFVALAKARKWSNLKTIWITIVCGIGHIGGSLVLGGIGIAFGLAISKLNYFDSIRGNVAGWLLITFGLIYALWGLRQVSKNKIHNHSHVHVHGLWHKHDHDHSIEHVHPHFEDETSAKKSYKSLTPWLLFLIFIFGPCEVLIPMLMYLAYQHDTVGIVLFTSIFGIITIATMTTVVLLMKYGISFLKFGKLEKYSHALAGTTLFLCGVSIQFLGL